MYEDLLQVHSEFDRMWETIVASCYMPFARLMKRTLLTHLAHVKEADAKDVASAFGVGYEVAAMALLRLVRQGLANRHRVGKRGVYRYRLSERGHSRLEYLGGRRGALG